MLFDRIQGLRPLFRVPDPAPRTEYLPGELAHRGLWFPPVDVPLGFGQVGRPPGAGDGLRLLAVDDRGDDLVAAGPDLLAGRWQLIAGLAAASKTLMWDNESAVGSSTVALSTGWSYVSRRFIDLIVIRTPPFRSRVRYRRTRRTGVPTPRTRRSVRPDVHKTCSCPDGVAFVCEIPGLLDAVLVVDCLGLLRPLQP